MSPPAVRFPRPILPDDHGLALEGLIRIFQLNGEPFDPALQHDIAEVTFATLSTGGTDVEARRIKKRFSAVRTETSLLIHRQCLKYTLIAEDWKLLRGQRAAIGVDG